MSIRISLFIRKIGLAFLLVIPIVSPLFAAKTDVLVLKNGDRITGEIKSLENGILKYSTDHMGTLSIEWPGVLHFSSSQHFEIEMEDGNKYFGTFLETDEEGNLTLLGPVESYSLKVINIVAMKPIGQNLKDQIDAGINLGYSYSKAQTTQQINLSGYLILRKLGVVNSLSASSIISSRKETPTTSRADLEFRRDRSLKKPKLFYSLFAMGQENQELGLNLRLSAGSGLGKYLVHNNRSSFNLMAGLNITREDYENSETTENLEIQLGLRYDLFIFSDPETNLIIDWKVLPSVSNWGRVRSELSTRITHELFKDFTVNLELSGSYDSSPPEEAPEEVDYSIVTSVGWKY